jgi:hypothetical protein
LCSHNLIRLPRLMTQQQGSLSQQCASIRDGAYRKLHRRVQ